MKKLLSLFVFLIVFGFSSNAFSNCFVCVGLPGGSIACWHFTTMSCSDLGDISSYGAGCADVGALIAPGPGSTVGDHLYRTIDGGAAIVTKTGKRYIVAGDETQKWAKTNAKQLPKSKERWEVFTKMLQTNPQKVSDSSLKKLSKQLGLPIEKEPTSKPTKK